MTDTPIEKSPAQKLAEALGATPPIGLSRQRPSSVPSGSPERRPSRLTPSPLKPSRELQSRNGGKKSFAIDRRYPNASITRSIAGCLWFFTLTQCLARPRPLVPELFRSFLTLPLVSAQICPSCRAKPSGVPFQKTKSVWWGNCNDHSYWA